MLPRRSQFLDRPPDVFRRIDGPGDGGQVAVCLEIWRVRRECLYLACTPVTTCEIDNVAVRFQPHVEHVGCSRHVARTTERDAVESLMRSDTIDQAPAGETGLHAQIP